MESSENRPVDAHLVVRYAVADNGSEVSTGMVGGPGGATCEQGSRRGSVQGSSICVVEPWRGPARGETPEAAPTRRLSASMRVCDLYQCVHSREGSMSGPAGGEELSPGASPGTSPRASIAQQGVGGAEARVPTAAAVPPPSRHSSLSSSSSQRSPRSRTGSQDSEVLGACSGHECASHDAHADCWIDASTPCGRHHHRRNSTAIKFRKALYEDPGT
ncbi:LAQU0S09e02608g1_1 [Lachancea quebecensis]|uniref:LAQU0S09e02608g1_1 n=1 Tax=Lachancea quebecensis TaxID=1654605 RepID=A0A0P1L1Z5_9SACH|nr:LAQU0S09e02608g1_1 [Lachancea quebecensis]